MYVYIYVYMYTFSPGDVMPTSGVYRGMFLGATPLHLAFMIRDSQFAKAVVGLLLQHKMCLCVCQCVYEYV